MWDLAINISVTDVRHKDRGKIRDSILLNFKTLTEATRVISEINRSAVLHDEESVAFELYEVDEIYAEGKMSIGK